VNWNSVFFMFGMALTRPSLTMQLTSSVDVFTHVCRQRCIFRTTIVTIFSHYDKWRFSFCQMWHHILIVFLWKLPQIQCSNFRKVVRQHELTKLSPWVWCTTLWGTVYIFTIAKLQSLVKQFSSVQLNLLQASRRWAYCKYPYGVCWSVAPSGD